MGFKKIDINKDHQCFNRWFFFWILFQGPPRSQMYFFKNMSRGYEGCKVKYFHKDHQGWTRGFLGIFFQGYQWGFFDNISPWPLKLKTGLSWGFIKRICSRTIKALNVNIFKNIFSRTIMVINVDFLRIFSEGALRI